MKTQIHELRTRIDGLAQLVQSLSKPILTIENSCDPEMSMDELMDQLKQPGIIEYSPSQSRMEYISGGLSFLAESYKSLLLAKAWLGKVLAELGEETPYKNDGNRKTVEDIEPTADKNIPINNGADLIKGKIGTCEEGNAGYSFGKIEDCRNVNFEYFSDKTYIEKIDWLREEIQKLSESIFSFKESYLTFKTMSYKGNIASTKSYEYLTEARFHLGFELSRIKEQSK